MHCKALKQGCTGLDCSCLCKACAAARVAALPHRALFLVGAPGVGKTTQIRLLLQPEQLFLCMISKPKWTHTQNICAAGHYAGQTFDGADTVPYNGVQEALDYWARNFKKRMRLTIFDGDRFSHAGAVEFVKKHDVDVRVVLLTATANNLDARRKSRGSNQNATWLKGRETKAENFAENFGGRVVNTDRNITAVHADLLKMLR